LQFRLSDPPQINPHVRVFSSVAFNRSGVAGEEVCEDCALAIEEAVRKSAGTRRDMEQIVPAGKVYNHSKRMKEKRTVLDGVAAELRRIIGEPAEAALRLVA
jgi:hypothetical protein